MTTQLAGKRPLGALGRMGMVGGLHVAALYLIATSLGIVPPLIKEPPPFILESRDTTPPDDPLPPPPQPQNFQQPVVTMPVPVVPTDAIEPPTDPITARPADEPPIIEVIPPQPATALVGVRQDSRHPLTQPAYPSIDIRQGNEGSVELEVYVLPNGRIGDVRVLKSAGSPTLDQSAVDEAKRRWRMLPATRDGEPYAQWHRLKVTFSLRNR